MGLMMHPLSIQITTLDTVEQREIQQQFLVETRNPRWEMFKILMRAMITMKFR